MKALFVVLCVLAAFIVCSETLLCYNCPDGSSREYCEANATIENCTNVQNTCVTRVIVYNGSQNDELVRVNKNCYHTANVPQYCITLNLPTIPSYEDKNCTKSSCSEDLCNSIPVTTTATPTTGLSTTGLSTTNATIQTNETSRPPITTKACPPTSCGKGNFCQNSVFVALVLSVSHVLVNSF